MSWRENKESEGKRNETSNKNRGGMNLEIEHEGQEGNYKKGNVQIWDGARSGGWIKEGGGVCTPWIAVL